MTGTTPGTFNGLMINTLFAPMLVGVALIAVALVFAVAPQMRRGFRFIRSFSNFCE